MGYDGYVNRTGFGTARLAIGGKVAWLGWTLGAALTLIGVFTPSRLLLIIGAALLFSMVVGGLLRLRDRRDSERIAERPPMPLPHAGANTPPRVNLPRLGGGKRR